MDVLRGITAPLPGASLAIAADSAAIAEQTALPHVREAVGDATIDVIGSSHRL